MRRVTFTKDVTLSATFDYEKASEEGQVPRLHEIQMKAGESLELYEWGWEDKYTNFAGDDPQLLARVIPGDSAQGVVCLLAVPYECHNSEAAFEAVDELNRPPIIPQTIFQFPVDSGFLEEDDLVESDLSVASTA